MTDSLGALLVKLFIAISEERQCYQQQLAAAEQAYWESKLCSTPPITMNRTKPTGTSPNPNGGPDEQL